MNSAAKFGAISNGAAHGPSTDFLHLQGLATRKYLGARLALAALCSTALFVWKALKPMLVPVTTAETAATNAASD